VGRHRPGRSGRRGAGTAAHRAAAVPQHPAHQRRAEGCLQTRVGLGRSDQLAAKDIAALIDWIDTYCREHGRDDTVPADPAGAPITTSRLRRTWPGSSPDGPAAWSPQRSSTGTSASK
jgi:hypothetical protein